MMTELQKRTAQAIVNIFETGAILGDYGNVTLLKGDTGHLTYGRSQTTLGSGNLFVLLRDYCDAANAQFADGISPFLQRLQQRDLSLDNDASLRGLLQQAGNDPVMRQTQDTFFDRVYLDPALQDATASNLVTPLGQTVVYDSHVQGGWVRIPTRVLADVGPVSTDIPEDKWIARYVDTRKQWLASSADPLPKTVYRMDTFNDLISANQWELGLPLTVRGKVISEATLQGQPKSRTLKLQTPGLTGDDVRALQSALNAQGFANTPDGVFGPGTDALVKQFQQAKGLQPDGVAGPQTRAALGLS
jgi:chitosanase